MTTTQLLFTAVTTLSGVIVILAGVIRFLYKERQKKDEIILQLARNGISSEKLKGIVELLERYREDKKRIGSRELDEMTAMIKEFREMKRQQNA